MRRVWSKTYYVFQLIHGNQPWHHPKNNKKDLVRNSETGWNVAEDSRLKRQRKTELRSKKDWGKEKDKFFKGKNWLKCHVKVILILLFKNISHQKIIHYVIAVDHKGYNINSFQQTVEQIKVVQQEVLPEVSKLNDSSY